MPFLSRFESSQRYSIPKKIDIAAFPIKYTIKGKPFKHKIFNVSTNYKTIQT